MGGGGANAPSAPPPFAYVPGSTISALKMRRYEFIVICFVQFCILLVSYTSDSANNSVPCLLPNSYLQTYMFSSCGKKNMWKCAYVVLCSNDMVKAHMVSEFSVICLVVFA